MWEELCGLHTCKIQTQAATRPLSVMFNKIKYAKRYYCAEDFPAPAGTTTNEEEAGGGSLQYSDDKLRVQ